MHHRFHHFFGRHQGRHGFGPFGRGFMEGGGMGGRGFGMGRKLASADLQLLILGLLNEKPSHGYEIIKALEERSNGFYVPSPGMVYPALTYLEEIGHATVAAAGTKKQYSITPDGVAHLEANRATADTLLEQLAWIGQRMNDVRRAFGGAADAATGEDFDAPRGPGGRGDFIVEIRRARRSLKGALVAKFGASPDEQKRIAEILERAAREIRGE